MFSDQDAPERNERDFTGTSNDQAVVEDTQANESAEDGELLADTAEPGSAAADDDAE